ncbi:MAG: aminodeoxychorismate/anthranilate synthase component II [Verrucomicrobiota bacterium]
MKVLIIDNYDSFTYNLYQYVGEILEARDDAFEVIVKRNDEIDLAGIEALAPDRIIVSPGPGTPKDPEYFGVCADAITKLGPKIPLLGVCLGMQGIVYCFGGDVVHAPLPMHGKTSDIAHDNSGPFANLPQHVEIMRYHSLMAEPLSLPDSLRITAIVDDDHSASEDYSAESKSGKEIMGVQHKEFPIYGIQYHPESFATEGGKRMLENFLGD